MWFDKTGNPVEGPRVLPFFDEIQNSDLDRVEQDVDLDRVEQDVIEDDMFFTLESYNKVMKGKEVSILDKNFPQICKAKTASKASPWSSFNIEKYDDKVRVCLYRRGPQEKRDSRNDADTEESTVWDTHDDDMEDFIYRDRPMRALAGVDVSQSSDEDFTACLDFL